MCVSWTADWLRCGVTWVWCTGSTHASWTWWRLRPSRPRMCSCAPPRLDTSRASRPRTRSTRPMLPIQRGSLAASLLASRVHCSSSFSVHMRNAFNVQCSFECTREFMLILVCAVGRVRQRVLVSSSTACTSRCTRAATSRSPPTASRAIRSAPFSRRGARVRSGASRPSRRARASTSPSSRHPSRLPSCFHGIRAQCN